MNVDFATTALLANMALAEAPTLDSLSPEDARLAYSEIFKGLPDGPDNVSSEDMEIPVDGATIGCRILRPTGKANSVIVYYHGGGWVIGNIDDYDALGRHIAERCNAVVVLVNYRKAPEHKFPIPVNDCYAALNWVSDNMKKIAGANLPIMVAGDSAGGNLSAVIAQKTVRENGPKIDLQILVYPVTDGRMNSATWKDDARQLFLTKELMEHFWRHYADDEQLTDPEASPLLADDLKSLDGLAPAVVLTAEMDILRDEGAAYAQKLEEAGVDVTYKEFKRQIHGFVGLADALPVGFEALDWVSTRIDAHLNSVDHFDAVIVGAGFSGMYQLHRLREKGLNVRVFEAGTGVGGTWYWNRYPGARVDIESVAYSYSFSKELEQDWVWSEKHATQPELLEYANHVADRFDLRKDIQFETKVASAHFDDDMNEWLVTMENGDAVRARYLIMASGVLSASKKPDIPGYDNFKGETYNTGSWPHDPVDFSGKKVAVIGTGSSGIQAIPLVAEQADELVVFQRTANFSTPALNRTLSNSEIDAIKSDYPGFRAECRKSRLGAISPEPQLDRAMEATAEEREARFQTGWETGLLPSFFFAFGDILTDEKANEAAQDFIRDRIRGIVEDEQTREDLLPNTHPYGTKRPCLDTNYYETFNRDNVSLVNLRRTPIDTITEKGIKTSDTEREFDAIIFATGFDAMTGPLLRVDIRGSKGRRLIDAWVDGPQSYLGVGVSGFPNMFTINGPSSPSVLSNMMVSIEQHVDWIADCIGWMNSNDKTRIEPERSAEIQWAEHTSQMADMTLYPQADSWYVGANVPGKPRAFLAYVGGVGVYREICDQIAQSGYYGFEVN